mgnify:CR=1 FL=1
MPRQARKKSTTGIYHVILRGINKRDIFLDEQDKTRFIEHLRKSKMSGGFQLYAYCLMTNHVHLLMKEDDEEIGNSVKRIGIRYAAWHNKKYDRIGHLFQNRFLSEPVEDDRYLITLLRYILQNPVKAGMVNKPEEYPWSSFNQHVLAYQGENTFINHAIIMDYFSSYDDFYFHINLTNEDKCIDYDSRIKYNDDELKSIVLEKHDISNLHKLSVRERNRAIGVIYLDTDASARQLSRVLGVSYNIIRNAIREHGRSYVSMGTGRNEIDKKGICAGTAADT